jgi:hypothetical protein
MSARVINLAEARAIRARARMKATSETVATAETVKTHEVNEITGLMQRFQFWTGASGQRYVHTIYTLLDCPALSGGNYILVHRDGDGQRTILDIGELSAHSPSLNLADMRQRGAMLGANEVHVHLLADSPRETRRIAFDLQSGNFDASADRSSVTQH